MKTYVLRFRFILLLFVLSVFLSEQSIASGSMVYIMHSFFKIKTGEGKVIYIDPALVHSLEDSADIVLISHEHQDHNDLRRIRQKKSCVLIRAADALKEGIYQTFNIGNIKITAVPAYNSYHQKNASVGYVIEFDTIKIYHPGDTGKIDEMAELASRNITYALLPMDGTYTMTPAEATQATAMIKAQYDIPMHTLAGIQGYDETKADAFASPNKLIIKPGTTISLSNPPTSVKEKKNNSKSFGLMQNYPNPFNPRTNIEFTLDEPGFVSLKVFDPVGKEISTLINEEKSAGTHKISWASENITSGIYFYQIKAGSNLETKKMVLMR